MARAGILYSQVARAAAQLAAEGKNPTIDTVRVALGGTGSKSTIAPMLKQWKAEHQEVVAGAELGLPIELVDAVKSVYDRLQADVGLQLAAAREAHTRELDATHSKLEAAQADHRLLSAAHSDLSKELKRTGAELADHLQTLQANALALTAAQTKNVGFQQRLSDRAVEISALTHQLTQARTQFEHFQEATAHQHAEERQGFEQRIARLEHEVVASQRRQEAQQALIAQQESKLAHLLMDNERVQQALASVQVERETARSERDHQASLLQDMSAMRADADRRLEAALEALADAKAASAAATKEAAMLAAQLDAADKKADKAEQERSVLIEKLLAQRPAQAAGETVMPGT